MNIQVGIVEDEKQIRESLTVLINGSEGFSCIHAFETAEEAIISIPSLHLDVVLMDIHLPGKDGIDCILNLKPTCNSVQFLMCTSFEDTDSVFKALKAGTSGYITKTTQPSKILDAIVEVFNGGSPMSSNIARKVVNSFQNSNAENKEMLKLSEREKEILHLLSKGLRYKEIADSLFLSTETVRTHIRNIYEKLHVNSRIEALNKVFPK
ncbi:MAG: response regulator transcription factor [Flavobacteriia bacterium]|nr:response regulator transcription factor [Flavobacteriia bacterium]OIP45340.1 MAG: DNA-binding response regulator [Flavobacteriaceae bacterium CG2_30_31_66]PIV97710.1 MAG: DNA-binding response regulator [Flavobacteriaceae bacterium CG17_big_fil_post_rev_8_21_14_2_50_31_13]PIY15705.1 MAG: DNA-binding response regulator [Flavobacteriaceae bacterium CG_4_10_14_3_um_filter_31_253]PIZ11470.1 MAG: DNA-binding response regulator [Flavobacteriaceae bacterium CG_4_10_14_0_8_um_filter_31_99]PJC08763.1